MGAGVEVIAGRAHDLAADVLCARGDGRDDVVLAREEGCAAGRGDDVQILVDGEVRVGRAPLEPIGRHDAERIRVECGLAADGEEVVAGRRDDDALAHRTVDRALRVVELADERQRLDARERVEAEVDHVGAVIRRPANAGRDLLEAPALVREDLHGHELRRARDAGRCRCRCPSPQRRPRDVRAVRRGRLGRRPALPVAVAAAVRRLRTAGEGGAAHELALQVGMGEVDAAVRSPRPCPWTSPTPAPHGSAPGPTGGRNTGRSAVPRRPPPLPTRPRPRPRARRGRCASRCPALSSEPSALLPSGQLAKTGRAGWGGCAWQDSNLRPRAPEARALSPELQARSGVVYRA